MCPWREGVRRILLIFVLVALQGIRIDGQFNLYNTDRLLEYDCLYYRVRDEKLAYQELANVVEDTIPYCFRPINETEGFKFDIREQNLTFEELRSGNITSQELLSWSAPIDLVERYQFYLDTSLSLFGKEVFYNCTKPWFGSRCEYSFELSEDLSIDRIVQHEFSRKASNSELINFSCYVHLPCNRGGSALCLDWREICDGRVDCLDGGLDEAFCFDMEMNECNENEYRCQNGLCIPEEFWENGMGEADCLDRSDEIPDVSYPRSCFQDPTFRCEEHSCRANWHEFSCGDGQCVQKFDQCQNGRHRRLIQSMMMQGNLSDQCWIAMICLTKLDATVCQTWFTEDVAFEFLQTCESIFQFPILPVHHGHIRFLYEKPYLKFNESSFLFPDYICYDVQLCDCILPTFFYKNLTCIDYHELQFEASISGHPWIDMIFELNSYFSSCLTIHPPLNKKTMYENCSSMYSCQNSSKFISKHRLVDDNKDCCMGDDEDYPLSCSLNDKSRIQCPNGSLCLSSLHSIHDCPDFENQYSNSIPFHIFCDGFEEQFFEDSNGQRYTDESECQYWPCDNIYSRCDGYWSCSDGQDEENCQQNICPSRTHPCVSSMNYSVTCLSAERVGDGRIDCLGASDEMHFCREFYPGKKDYERFRCSESDLCLSALDLCDQIQSCPLGDDEHFCRNYRFICQEDSISNRSLIENVLCQLSEYQNPRLIYFALRSSMVYPRLQSTSAVLMNLTHVEQPIKSIESRMNRSPSPWYCNRGLPIRIRSNQDLYKYGCLCPPSYYGDLCQYQNERISLTLSFIRAIRHEIYTIVIMLIDDDDREIQSYDQFDYSPSQSCAMKFNRYLLYSTRPKHIFKNYSVRIDIFEKRTLTYRRSWHLSIPFLFLPVNRLVTRLIIPSHSIPISSPCSIQCNHGDCLKYMNKDKSFCRCLPGWSGIQCDIPINCQRCSSDSICIGAVNNHSICICPVTKFGPRCLLTSSCAINACENDGQCIPADLSIPGSDYTCLCSDQYFGSKCQYIKAKVDISFEDLDIPAYLTAFFLTVSEQSKPRLTILLQKLTLFQRTVTFRISIPYHIVLIKSTGKFYLAVVQESSQLALSSSINPNRECRSIEHIFNSTLMKLPRYQRIKFYHFPCQTDLNLSCFLDESYLCLCTTDHQANCVAFARQANLQCSSRDSCANEGQCLQDHPHCPSSIICVCRECFFGNQCQFYAKGLGLTLDEILGYEIKRNRFLSEQSFPVRLTAIVTMMMFIIGLINGICSILTFSNKSSQEVGCGMYLLASSITSLLMVNLFTLKFWFLLLSYTDFFAQRFLLSVNCMFIEPALKILLYTDNWFNGCIAAERAFAVLKGIHFNKSKSKQIAPWVILMIITTNIILLIPQLSNLRLFDDRQEERTWCVISYSSRLNLYHSFLLFFHFLTPFLINFFSAIFIIVSTARHRASTQSDQLYLNQLKTKLKQHKHLLISPIILIVLSFPRLIISFTLNCQKSSRHFWLYLIGYYLSLMPAVFVFVVFVLPSTGFRKTFKQVIRRHASFLKMTFFWKKGL